MDVIGACGISFPPMIAAQISCLGVGLSVLGVDLPVMSASKWKKINAVHRIQSLEKDLEKLEKAT